MKLFDMGTNMLRSPFIDSHPYLTNTLETTKFCRLFYIFASFFDDDFCIDLHLGFIRANLILRKLFSISFIPCSLAVNY